MHTSQGSNPFVIPTTITDQVDAIMAGARARFGHNAFRMEGEGDNGGSGEGQGTGQSSDQGTGSTGSDQQGQGSGSGQSAGQPNDQKADEKAAAQKVEDLPDWAQKIIKDTRAEAATNRTGKTAAEEQQQKILKAVAQAAGLKIDGDDDPTPEELAKQLGESNSTAREATVELAVFKAAATAGADPVGLTDSRTFMTKVGKLDPAADDFAAKVKAEIDAAVKDNPKLKATQAAGSSSADHAGGSGEHTPRTPKSLTDAVGGHYGT